MSRIHQLRFRSAETSSIASSSSSDIFASSDLYGEENPLDYPADDLSVSGPASLASNVGATTLISAGLLIITIWAVSLMARPDSLYTSAQTSAATASVMSPAAHTELQEAVPPSGVMVLGGELGLYHWQKDCPLANARSLKPGKHHRLSHSQRLRLSRFDAELRGLRPCNYCSEIEVWRHRSGGSADTLVNEKHRP